MHPKYKKQWLVWRSKHKADERKRKLLRSKVQLYKDLMDSGLTTQAFHLAFNHGG